MKEKFRPAFDVPILTKFFDSFIALAIPEKRIKEDLIELMNIREEDNILDFGCGTGTLLILAKQKHPKALFEGIDIDPKVLAIAKSKIERLMLDISLIEYDGGKLPQNDNSINKAMTSLMMHHLSTDKKLIAMREIFRVLTTGGKLYIADFGKQENLIFALVGNIAAKFEPEVEANFKGLLPDLMTDAGFKNVQTLKKYNTKIGTICIYSGEKTGNVSI
jgi:ubiquinone/menaquinone biosynthesis C-methylase UbiE